MIQWKVLHFVTVYSQSFEYEQILISRANNAFRRKMILESVLFQILSTIIKILTLIWCVLVSHSSFIAGKVGGGGRVVLRSTYSLANIYSKFTCLVTYVCQGTAIFHRTWPLQFMPMTISKHCYHSLLFETCVSHAVHTVWVVRVL